MPYSLTYVSSSRIADDEAETIVDEIVSWSRRNNAHIGLTGALIFTGCDFAQTLEGERARVLALVERIRADDRHTGFDVVHQAEQAGTDFDGWTMAYRGTTSFVQRHIDAVRTRAPVERRVAVLELRALLQAFAHEPAG
jgi:hypothetical protein